MILHFYTFVQCFFGGTDPGYVTVQPTGKMPKNEGKTEPVPAFPYLK